MPLCIHLRVCVGGVVLCEQVHAVTNMHAHSTGGCGDPEGGTESPKPKLPAIVSHQGGFWKLNMIP